MGLCYIVFIYLPSWCFVRVFGRRLRSMNLWIVSERADEARDNGYHLFRYLCENHPDVNALYAIKECADAEKVRLLGNTVPFGGYRHCIAFISAECILSTGFDLGYPNSMCGLLIRRYFSFINTKAKLVFLDHGIIKDKLPSIYKEKIKCDLFICGAEPEYRFMLDGFGYAREEVQYTGHARYDNLNDSSNEGYILFMPTWRQWLDAVEFEESEYFNRCKKLLLSDRFEDSLKKAEIKLYFYLHPRAQKYRSFFSSDSSHVEILDASEYDLQELMKGANAFITDYSSTFFDMAYLHKPMIFFHYDYEQFRKGHYPEGYFDYQRDGFGPVVQTSDQVLEELEKIISNSFQMKSKYIARVDTCFVYRDNKNCERIFQCIQDLLDKKG
ncbi:CDP-glycerol glycerophosphotransferase family protein [Akkermansiaceae bacterium]|nr:CDP-glycerol glycerophosphotransferase family protein [Akkermansiaceae bacterium]MDB4586230.1 CDP-glycerol glycerophosphotransferase family protein [Akkermansiaceae bacterium]MDB4625970.1 CDP-glycerol glycerophosphotransferase family protein [Akkermansiaceae bacterium]